MEQTKLNRQVESAEDSAFEDTVVRQRPSKIDLGTDQIVNGIQVGARGRYICYCRNHACDDVEKIEIWFCDCSRCAVADSAKTYAGNPVTHRLPGSRR